MGWQGTVLEGRLGWLAGTGRAGQGGQGGKSLLLGGKWIFGVKIFSSELKNVEIT